MKQAFSMSILNESYDVRWKVAGNPNTPEEALLLIKSREFQNNKSLLKLAH